ncbi:hypothetical protein ACVWYG_000724 [Pedobacter sp. UYEF25]
METRETKLNLLTGLLNGTVKPSDVKPRLEIRYFEDKPTHYIVDGKQATENELHEQLAKEPALTNALVIYNVDGSVNTDEYYY